jgi:hypothetical protein
MQKKLQFSRQRLFAAKAIPDGAFSIARQWYVAANDISVSISNACADSHTFADSDVVGKCEQEQVRGDVKYCLFGVIA